MLAIIVILTLFLAGCAAPLFKAGIRPGEVYVFALPEEEIERMKEETFEQILHRPHPLKEKRLAAALPQQKPNEEGEKPKRFVSEDGFPLITFKGGPMYLGQALEFIAGSAGYRVEWAEGVNRALWVDTTFSDAPIHRVLAALLEPFGYFAVVDGKKGIVRVSLKPEIEVEEAESRSKGELQ